MPITVRRPSSASRLAGWTACPLDEEDCPVRCVRGARAPVSPTLPGVTWETRRWLERFAAAKRLQLGAWRQWSRVPLSLSFPLVPAYADWLTRDVCNILFRCKQQHNGWRIYVSTLPSAMRSVTRHYQVLLTATRSFPRGNACFRVPVCFRNTTEVRREIICTRF